jgi:hypothetical protein
MKGYRFITTLKTIDIVTGRVIEWKGYFYDGPVDLLCCSGDSTVKSTETAQAAFTNTLNSSFKTAFGNNQSILGSLTSKLTDSMNNPQGFSPSVLASMRTNATQNVQQQVKNAQVAANAYGASHGTADIGSGVQAQIQGGIGSAGATETANELNNINIQSGLLQNQNYWNAISGLTNVAQAQNPTGYAGAETSAANSVGNLSQAYLASQQAGWQDVGGIVSGIAGLGMAGVGAFNGLGFGGSNVGTAGKA